ncbi:HAD family phosphatase [Cellulomonas sp. KRMCY2]|uniref:HAD family hydrolase n=1 Tax=Cellulomonas sp. KRMCY2 TaxID=1304865 RepID=UPI00045E745D|nr:HAD family phosphatase [Cellulomonas sp. KRMCY2]
MPHAAEPSVGEPAGAAHGSAATSETPSDAPSDPPSAPRAPVASGRLPDAVLWDMDGTLVDTEPSWMGAERGLVEEFGGRWTAQDAERMIGLPLPAAAQILQDHGVDLPIEAIGVRLVDGVIAAVGRRLDWQPGALELLAALREAAVPCALVTMSYRRFAQAVLYQGPPEAFDAVVTGDEITHPKPHPEPYLRAAELLGVDIRRCVAIEDSPPGLASALASGARTLGVQHIVPVERRPGLSRVSSLVDIGLGELRRIASGEVLDLLDATAGADATVSAAGGPRG